MILTYDADFTIPISQINENMSRAQRRDSVRQEKFYFRASSKIRLMSINEIINGSIDFTGLVPLVRQYLVDLEDIDVATRITVERYLTFISERALGILLTDASWIRQFVVSHPDYKQDSVVSDRIQYDLLWKIVQITDESESCAFLIDSSSTN